MASNQPEYGVPSLAFNPLDLPSAEEAAGAATLQDRADDERTLDIAVNRVFFHTRDGKLILDWLRRVTEQNVGFDAGLGFYDGAAAGFELNGMRKFLQSIKARAKRAEEG